jgi:two-component system response regulator HydG
MRVEELNHENLLELDPLGGLIEFAGQRALLIDAVAMGLLRKYLVENFGLTPARTVFTQFGFAHGWRMAEAVRADYRWETDDDWRRAGMRLNALGGLYGVEVGSDDLLSKQGADISVSYEAEQHLLHFGRSEVPACWMICGLVSGYTSRSVGHEIYVMEDRCVAKGDPRCHLIGRTRAELEEMGAEELRYFEPGRLSECLDVSLQRVMATLRAAERKLRDHRRALVHVAPEVETHGLVARSAAMREVVDLARRVALVDSTVLITGESGAGKERIARLVHTESTRASGPFVAVNCGAITETLLEAELFGHARGAFTGATQDRAGLFEAANRGTLLLDEIGEVSPGMQVKLLRVLQEREVRRVGESKSRRVDVRVVASTNRDLDHHVESGKFRRDLYYRLKVVNLQVPALRQRPDDILPLARALLAEASVRMKRPMTGLAPAVAELLLKYKWPGNVRELANAMERSVALARGTRVELEDLPNDVRGVLLGHGTVDGSVRFLEEVEREYILAALAHNGGNQTHTARQLGIGTATLYRKLKSYRASTDGARTEARAGSASTIKMTA